MWNCGWGTVGSIIGIGKRRKKREMTETDAAASSPCGSFYACKKWANPSLRLSSVHNNDANPAPGVRVERRCRWIWLERATEDAAKKGEYLQPLPLCVSACYNVWISCGQPPFPKVQSIRQPWLRQDVLLRDFFRDLETHRGLIV